MKSKTRRFMGLYSGKKKKKRKVVGPRKRSCSSFFFNYFLKNPFDNLWIQTRTAPKLDAENIRSRFSFFNFARGTWFFFFYYFSIWKRRLYRVTRGIFGSLFLLPHMHSCDRADAHLQRIAKLEQDELIS